MAAGKQREQQPEGSSSEEPDADDIVKAGEKGVNGTSVAANGGLTGVKKRSRSATRKAIKRKLRREGVLPRTSKKPQQQQQQQQLQGRHQQQQRVAEQPVMTGVLQQESGGISKQAGASTSKQPSILEVAALAPALNPNVPWHATARTHMVRCGMLQHEL